MQKGVDSAGNDTRAIYYFEILLPAHAERRISLGHPREAGVIPSGRREERGDTYLDRGSTSPWLIAVDSSCNRVATPNRV